MEGEVLYAYLAGIMVEVGNMCKDVIDLYTDNFNGSVWQKTLKNGGAFYCWRVTGTNCKSVLEELLPYLVVKKEQALVCLEMVARLGIRGGIGWSGEKRATETVERNRLYFAMKKLNFHGKRSI